MKRVLPFLVLFIFSIPGARALASDNPNASPVELLQDALDAYFNERYDESVHLFQKILLIDKNNASAKKGLKNAEKQYQLQVEKLRAEERPALASAEDYLKRDALVEAYDRVRGILDRVPDHPQALKMLKEIRSRAEKTAAKAKKESSDWYFANGTLAYMDGDWFKAADSWEQVYAFNPDRVDLVGKIDRAKKNLAEQQRQEKIRLNLSVAWSSYKQGNYDDALKAFNDTLAVDPANTEAKEGLKQATRAGEEQKAKRQVEELQNMSAKAMDLYLEHDYKGSVAVWNKVLAMDPGNPLAREYLMRIRERGGTAASSASTTLLSTPLPMPSGTYQRAVDFMNEERFTEAIEAFERYLARNPGDGKAQSYLDQTRTRQKVLAEKAYKEGLTAYSQGDRPAAMRKWQDALRIFPDYPQAKSALVKTMQESKRK